MPRDATELTVHATQSTVWLHGCTLVRGVPRVWVDGPLFACSLLCVRYERRVVYIVGKRIT